MQGENQAADTEDIPHRGIRDNSNHQLAEWPSRNCVSMGEYSVDVLGGRARVNHGSNAPQGFSEKDHQKQIPTCEDDIRKPGSTCPSTSIFKHLQTAAFCYELSS